MNRADVINIMHSQAITLDNDVKNKLAMLMSDEVVFTDISSYVNADFVNHDRNMLQDAFSSIGVAVSRNDIAADDISGVEEGSSSEMLQINGTKTIKGGLSQKIAALRGCSTPGSYLSK